MPSQTTNLQRFLTTEFISKRRLNIPAVWLKPEGLTPSVEDVVADSVSTDLGAWDEQNLGVRLVDGHIELRLDTPDDVWAACLFKAFRFLSVDARAAYGVHHVSSILINVDGEIDRWAHRWPKGHIDHQGRKVRTEFRYSAAATKTAKAIYRTSAPLPGSLIGGEAVCWRPWGKPPADIIELGVEDLEHRALAATTMESICRGIAYATLLYWIGVNLDGLTEWDASLVRIIAGWLAKIVPEGAAINAQGKSLEGICWSPIDSPATAGQLVAFLQEHGHAPKEIGVNFIHAAGQLERDPMAHVPGWSSLEDALGVQAKMGVRRAFRAGLDLDMIEMLAERYVYDETSHHYLDRESLIQELHFEHSKDDLTSKWDNEPFFINGKRHNPFRIYAGSQLRTDVKRREFFPGDEPGALLRFSPLHGVVVGEDKHGDEYRTLNVFPGFKIKPIATPDPVIMATAISMLDKMLGLLTQDNDAQMRWLKQFVAWIAQHPEIKPQVCPIIIGGQGIGKSLFGDTLMRALFGSMAGMADAGALSDNKFLITPFVGKLITFIDEVRLESPAAINVIKKLIRQDYVSGQMKYGHQHDYYIPSRLLIASNQIDIGLTPLDAADRAFFFIMSWTAKKKGMSDADFLVWALGLKPFYADFIERLGDVTFRQHLMRYFVEFEVMRADLEDLRHSSRNDEEIVRQFSSEARNMAREMVADARILAHRDITAWFSVANVREAIRRVENSKYTKMQAGDVMAEFENAGVLESMTQGMYRFKYGYYKLCQKMGHAHGMPLSPFWPTKPGDGDYGDNEVRSSSGGEPWRGDNPKNRRDSADPRATYDPDHLDM